MVYAKFYGMKPKVWYGYRWFGMVRDGLVWLEMVWYGTSIDGEPICDFYHAAKQIRTDEHNYSTF